ncbi:hypothetical protein [Sphingosinicella sp.]|jgi:hypothetical protein|uniref:TRAFAC clade GTPase domain-containing protein n=1 Tax=Sphingosinicella sp. TaxID=1917971 RepID=UPI001791E718|nr:hypothetical protein [Sphingosinicella sp.]MBA4760007.1 hypothetical protein [Sphingosinicella sp.]
MIDLAYATCRVEGCGGPRSGVCINKLSFEECPDVIGADEVTVEDSDGGGPSEEEEIPSIVATNIGDSLDADACDRILRASGGKLIGIVAGPEAGKTTLIATIYELIHRAKIAGIGFAGSDTLRGYEERCHLARVASNATKPETLRTKTWEQLSFTHLKLAIDHQRLDVLFSDRSGEHFDNVLDTPGDILGFEELIRADQIWIVVDLERLSQNGHMLKSQLRRLALAMQSAALFDGKDVAIVGTKADIFSAKRALAAVKQELMALADDLKGRIGSTRSFATYLVACRPPKGSTEFGAGIGELMASLSRPEEEAVCAMRFPLPEKPSELDRVVNRLGPHA